MAKDRKRYAKALQAGAHYNKQEEWQKAIRAFRIAIDEFPKEPAPYAGLGEACLGLKQLDRALECYKLAVRYGRSDISYLKKVADIQERQGKLSEAGRTYMAIGEILLKMRHLDEAIDHWQRAIRLESNLLGAHKRLAMVFQRKNKTKDAVRSYLAIARILQMRGEPDKALRMCQAAERLDPDNEDVQTAMKLIHLGEQGMDEPEEPEEETAAPASEADQLTDTIRQLTAAFESDRPEPAPKKQAADPIEAARELAHDQLAAEIFREEDVHGDTDDENSLSKLERDALIGQGMDFEGRNQIKEAISCYQRAIDGGLKLPAAHLVLGLLYLEDDQREAAKKVLRYAGINTTYVAAIKAALAARK